MATSAAWLGARLQSAAGRSVVFVRDDIVSAALVGVPTMQDYTVFDKEGFATQVKSYDWTFTTSELPTADPWPIRKGDRIRETILGTDYEYELLPLGNKPAFELADTNGVLTIVHTKKVK